MCLLTYYVNDVILITIIMAIVISSFELQEPIQDVLIRNGNRTVIIRVINKIGRPRFVNHEYDYRPNWTTRCPVTN